MSEEKSVLEDSPKSPDTQSASTESSQSPDIARPAPRRKATLRSWVKPLVQPALLLSAGALLIVALGAAQKVGWISAGDGGNGSGGGDHATSGGEDIRYICPMMCTPPQTEPGRCPVCAMELVPAASSSNGDERSIEVDPAARRVANIRTVAVKAVPLTRKIRAIGELSYDEGKLKTIAAYVDGRLDRLYADYTGVVVDKGDHLAWIYSPELYTSQVELLVAKRSRDRNEIVGMGPSGRDLYESALERLTEFGMTTSQIRELEKAGKANSRMHLCAPISGTVIEKLAVEGQYVKTGQPIYRLADLSTVWLMLELFPEDAAAIRYGQKVKATVQSLPSREFTGRVAFIDPIVDRDTRTVGVRVVMPNPDGLLRIGDFAKATLDVHLSGSADQPAQIYDPELADKWISPRHPHVVESSPGKCRECNVELVPASQFGFTSEPSATERALVVPRNAVLMAGDSSVVYVESEPGRFELRAVLLGPSNGNEIAILEGIEEGEMVACSGNFLIDSQMQLAGNPSLIDPTKAEPSMELDPAKSAEIIAALSGLSDDDRALAESQEICPVTKMPLGSMGAPPKVEFDGRPIFLCCMGCEKRLRDNPDKYLANLEQPASGGAGEDPEVAAALAKLSPEDRELATRQRICPVADMPLGSMGTPTKVDVNGTPVFICCEGCRESLLEEPDKYLAKLAGQSPTEGTDTASNGPGVPETGLPPIGAPQMVASQPVLPSMQAPSAVSDDSLAIADALAQLSPADRALAEKQGTCPVADMPLGSMGTPIKVDVNGRPVFICCEGCRESLLDAPTKYLAKLPKEAAR